MQMTSINIRSTFIFSLGMKSVENYLDTHVITLFVFMDEDEFYSFKHDVDG